MYHPPLPKPARPSLVHDIILRVPHLDSMRIQISTYNAVIINVEYGFGTTRAQLRT